MIKLYFCKSVKLWINMRKYKKTAQKSEKKDCNAASGKENKNIMLCNNYKCSYILISIFAIFVKPTTEH